VFRRRREGSVEAKGSIYVLTGDRGCGKTAVCARVADDAHQRGLTVAGILTERSGPEQSARRKVVDLRSGEGRLFGSQAQHGETQAAAAGADSRCYTDTGSSRDGPVPTERTTSDPLTPGWEFESEVFAWANAVLSRATPCDLLVIDEVGPLELLGGRGWAKALDVIRAQEFRAALVVCRPGLLEELANCLGMPPAAVFTVAPENRDTLPAAILEEVLR
jgi:nucleoside-triphosphatase THEP1